ncbi:nucleotidyltransferase AbiEii toxin of type IV toxin-antitoxin system [Micromonospora sp. M71_S20]|uniref:nucleotidyl transferase AbiEii/AbiGii toxin family protein n=1 Tax=Micromonospora sp. M71_S20 TaxID=592872 RepID=UPI000EADF282|nr:nucleotidyl transferase AbiEii/AbiGii toxin family protein [Micromonospora sp. M71_S20]RLK09765.1 nucleotidyltransferase AbiEii toxin of type IV toxin-antitoxin system [Micromonospora sp. M71_S20]
MSEVSGDFEIHITAHAHQAEKLSAFAARHGLRFVHIVLDRGAYVSQPMLTLTGRGTLAEQHATAQHWQRELREAGVYPCRSKIEAAPWCVWIPQSDEQAAAEPVGRYFEHHVKLLLPATAVADLVALTDLVAPHGARLSRNARRELTDGAQERFVNQRCHGVGLTTARQRLDELVETLRAADHEPVAMEQEYVVFDSDLHHDQGWLDSPTAVASGWDLEHENRMRSAPAGSPDYPPTYRPLPASPTVRQRAAFDPALKQYPNAYRAGEPDFLVAATDRLWTNARRAAMRHVLAAVAATTWGRHLVLRGSVTMAAWVGAAAREPGDLDFVVTPHTITSDSTDARVLLDDIKTAVRTAPGAGLRPDRITESAIWTYERADGRRLVIPFTTPQAPDGHVQVDVVFGERLPLPPEVLILPDVDEPLLAAPASLALAWKLLWLATDMYPQGKDLYDAVLLAEHTTVDQALVRQLMRPELGAEADGFTAETVLSWQVDWTNFTDECPGITGTAEQWARRLALALDHAWG